VEAGPDKHEVSRYQQLAAVPEEKLVAYIEQKKVAGGEITQSGPSEAGRGSGTRTCSPPIELGTGLRFLTAFAGRASPALTDRPATVPAATLCQAPRGVPPGALSRNHLVRYCCRIDVAVPRDHISTVATARTGSSCDSVHSIARPKKSSIAPFAAVMLPKFDALMRTA
jgi:hypothetical protein